VYKDKSKSKLIFDCLLDSAISLTFWSQVKIDPNNSELYDYRGILHSRNGDSDMARNDFTKAMVLD
jgi:Flp pilus assembly protein TadD